MSNSFLEQIGARLRERREGLCWGVNKVARICGVNPVYIEAIEAGAYKPPYSLYEDMSLTLGFTPSELFAGFCWTYEPPPKEGWEKYWTYTPPTQRKENFGYESNTRIA